MKSGDTTNTPQHTGNVSVYHRIWTKWRIKFSVSRSQQAAGIKLAVFNILLSNIPLAFRGFIHYLIQKLAIPVEVSRRNHWGKCYGPQSCGQANCSWWFLLIYNMKPGKPTKFSLICICKKKKKKTLSQTNTLHLIMRRVTVETIESHERSINLNVNVWDYSFIEQ